MDNNNYKRRALGKGLEELFSNEKPSVLLIDEIDKADEEVESFLLQAFFFESFLLEAFIFWMLTKVSSSIVFLASTPGPYRHPLVQFKASMKR